MAEASLKVIPGVDQNKTPALNEAALSSCNLVRFMPDRSGYGLVQKLGGWTAYYPTPISTTPRALWAWEDTNAATYLAVGNQAAPTSLQASLDIIAAGNLTNITPRTLTTNPAVNFTTTAGSSVVTIVDAGISTNNFDTVFISTPVAIDTLILSGFYPVTVVGGTTYTIQALNALGQPAYAAVGVSSGGAVPTYTTTTGSPTVTVTLANHGLVVGGSYSALIAAVFNGVTIFGNYTVLTVPTANTFTITASTTATAASTVSENNGNANMVYYIGFGPVQQGTGYGVGGSVNLSSYSSTGGVTTLNFASSLTVPIPVGASILLSGAGALNGTWTVATSSLGSLTFNTSSATFAVYGNGTTVTVQLPNSLVFPVGSSVVFSGFTSSPSINGAQTIVSSGAGYFTINSSATLISPSNLYVFYSGSSYTFSGATYSFVAGTGSIAWSPSTSGSGGVIQLGYGFGGYGSGTAITPTTGVPVFTNDWTLDNFGQILVACPVPELVAAFTNVTATGTGSTATLTLPSSTYVIPVGNVIKVTGMSISAYNGTYYVTASSAGSVSYASAATGAATGGSVGTIDPASGPIFYWDPTSGATTATVMSYGPPVNDGVFVAMPQRQVVAWGSTFAGIPDPLLIRWCDIQNFNTPGSWVAQSTNQAGSYRIPKGSRIVGCIQGPQQALVWTDLAVWSMQYIGQPYVYSFNELAVGCGLIGRKAAGSFNGVVYWMGQSQFFMLSGTGVSPIPCPVWDVVFQQLDISHANRIRCAVNSRFSEVAWYYPTTTSNGEVVAYVKYNTTIGQWDFGTLGRSAWINESVLGPPIGADPSSNYIYQHETSPDAANGTQAVAMNSWYQTGYFATNEADNKVFIDQVWPDAKWGYYNSTQSATLNLTFYLTDYPDQTPTAYGPYSLTVGTTYITPRMRGRLVSVYVSSNDLGSFWRIGNMRYRMMPDGKF